MLDTSLPRTAIVALLALAGLSNAAVLSRSIGFDITCDASNGPAWDDCKPILEALSQQSGQDANHQYTVDQAHGSNCAIRYTSTGNCEVIYCDLTGRGYVLAAPLTDAVSALYTDCRNGNSGGTAINTDGSMKVGITASKTNPAAKEKRDQTWENAYKTLNAAPDQYKQQVLSAQPGGSNWQLTNSETQTNQVEVSASINEGFWEVFEASQSVSYSYTKEVSSSSTSTIVNNCGNGQSGTLYWYPLFTQYHGSFLPDGPIGMDIYVPNVSGSTGAAEGKYKVVCSG